MRRIRVRGWGIVFVAFAGVLLLATFLRNAKAQTKAPAKPQPTQPARRDLQGGPHGSVRNVNGLPVEGVMIQLISQKNFVRTTVYTNELGKYEFPKLETGDYVMRIPRPLEFHPYQKDSVHIDGATALDNISLERVTNSEYLPPTPDLLPQLTESEWLSNLPGTAQEKKALMNQCGNACHSYLNPFRARFDEDSWRLIINRMRNYYNRILVVPLPAARGNSEEIELLTKWLSRIRGPESQNPPFKVYPRPQGPATRAVVTEYELPWVGVNIHDVAGDPQGNIWFTINRNPFIGKLDPKTGKVTSYKVPETPGRVPGQHWIQVEKDGTVWYSDTWSGKLVSFNPTTEKFHVMNTGGGVTQFSALNMALSPDGSIWRTDGGNINQFDRNTGEIIRKIPMEKARSTYGNFISWDGKYFGGGGNGGFDGIVFSDLKTGEIREIPTISGAARPSRGGFDPDGNAWTGGEGGVLVKYSPKTNVISEYAPPTPYVNFYSARSDKNGEIWAGEMHGGRIGRFNPRNLQWTEYQLPEPWAFDFNSWIDNSTTPVSFWYGDLYGYIVHVQPLE